MAKKPASIKARKQWFVLSVVSSAVLSTLSPAALAQTAIPNAGGVLQQIEPAVQQAPASSAPTFKREQPAPIDPALAGGQSVSVVRFEVVGNTSLEEGDIREVVRPFEGKDLTFNEVNNVAIALTRLYEKKGFSFNQVIVPPQVVQAGVVKLQVIEATYGQLRIANSSRVHNQLVDSTFSPLGRGVVINEKELNAVLLTASDIPGAKVLAVMAPGKEPGESDIDIELTPVSRFQGSGVVLDNGGGRSTGRNRVIGNLVVSNPFGMGDRLTVTGLRSVNGDTQYGRVGYEKVLDNYAGGSVIGGSYSFLTYDLGNGLEFLRGNGTARVVDGFLRVPMIRSQEHNFYGQFDVREVQLRDRLDALGVNNYRDVPTLRLSFFGDYRDNLFGSAISTYRVSAAAGQVKINDPVQRATDAAGLRTEGDFTLSEFAFTRLQQLAPKDALYFSLEANDATQNLDTSQKRIYSGINGVRAYDVGVVSGDRGVLSTLEYRRELGRLFEAKAVASVFYDYARVEINRFPTGTDQNKVEIEGVGAGLTLSFKDNLSLRLMIANMVGSKPNLLRGQSDARAWFTLSQLF